MNRNPYMPLFFGDFLASTADWDGEERSLYLTLLGHQWSLGSLPTDPRRIRKLVDWERELFERCWATVSTKFPEVDGRLLNGRLESHREKASSISAKRAESGKQGAKQRWQNDGKCHSDEKQLPPKTEVLSCHLIQSNLIEEEDKNHVPSGDVGRVFDHWKSEHSHPKAKIDAKRRKLITAALANYSADDLCRSISGYKNSPHHMGQNDRKTVYDDIEIFLRDAKHIDAGLKLYGNGSQVQW